MRFGTKSYRLTAMKKLKTTLIIVSLFSVMFAGCALSPKAKIKQPASRIEPGQTAGNSYYFFTRAQIARQNGNLKSAIDWMEKAVSADPKSAYLKKELAVLFLYDRKINRAQRLIKQLILEHPDDADALMMLAGINRYEGKKDEAAVLYEKVIKTDPDRENVYILLGSLYMAKNHADKAASIYQKMTKRFPGMWEGYFLLGNAHKRLGMLKQAEADYKKSIGLNKEAIGPRFALVELYKLMEKGTPITVRVKANDTLYSICKRVYGRYNKHLAKQIAAANPEIKDINLLKTGMTLRLPPRWTDKKSSFYRQKIIGLYKGILGDFPDNPRASFDLALYYESAGKRAAALKILKSMGQKSEKAPDSLQYLFREFIDKGQYAKARFILSGMIKGAPKSPALNYLMGMVQNRQNDKTGAIKSFGMVPKGSALYDGARFQMALLYDELGKTDQAIKILKARIKDEPGKAVHLFRLGKLYEKEKNYKKAIELYGKASKLDPDNVEILFRLGVAYDKAGQKDRLIEQMKLVIKKDPKNASALNYLGYTYAEMGKNLDEAQSLIERALAVEPKDGYITDSLGWVYFKKGNIDKALIFLKKAVSLEPEDPVLLEHLGDAYLKKGDKVKALEAYKRSREHYEGDTSGIDAKIRSLSKETSR